MSLDAADLRVAGNATLEQYSRLSGTGRIHGDLIARDATLQPGDPTGELEVDNNLRMEDNATLAIGIEGGENNCGRLAVNGNATIDEASLRITDHTVGEVRDGETYTYLTAEQVDGNFRACRSTQCSLISYGIG